MSELIYSTKTACNPIFIYQHGNCRQLKFDPDSRAVQSVIDQTRPHKIEMENLQYLMGILMFIPAPQKILLLGIGGGTLVHFFRHYFPQCDITAIDFDAELIEIAQKYLYLPAPSPDTHYIAQDAGTFLAESTAQFDLVVVDIFNDRQSPAWLLQAEMMQLMSARLSSSGAAAYNLLIKNDQTFKQFYAALRKQFKQQTLVMETEANENILAYALNHKKAALTFSENIQRAHELKAQFDLPLPEIMSTIYSINPIDSGMI